MLPFNQHFHDEYAIANSIFQDENCEVIGLEEYVTAFMNTPPTCNISINLHKSPDVNPTQNVWDMLEQQVKSKHKHPRNLVKLRYGILRVD